MGSVRSVLRFAVALAMAAGEFDSSAGGGVRAHEL